MRKRKRGQFYLMAALVIILIIIGFATISNYSRTQKYTRTYDLGEELEIESASVLDYGIYNENIGVDQMKNLLEGFLDEYTKMGQDIQQLHFIFGNAQQVVFMGWNDLDSNLTVELSANEGEYSILEIRKQQVEYQEFSSEEDFIEIVTIRLSYDGETNEFNFELNPGENFYFILSQVTEGERYVTYG
ncbi:MAG: hypothetical protein ABIA78_01365 [archaeon]